MSLSRSCSRAAKLLSTVHEAAAEQCSVQKLTALSEAGSYSGLFSTASSSIIRCHALHSASSASTSTSTS